MAIDLSSRLSAITVDGAGVTHVVWVDGQQILHAKYDANAQEWVDTQVIASGLFDKVTSLNLVADPELISTSNGQIPGLAVVYQQGSDNESEFHYTAAKYDENRNLQWLETPVQLTDNEIGDLEPRAIVQDNQVNVVGQKLNVEKAETQSVRDDSDLYYQKFTVKDSQFTSASTNTPAAPYSPNTSTDGVITGYSNNASSQNAKNVSPTANYTPVTAKEASTIVTKGDFQGWGWKFNVEQEFGTNVLQDWGIIKAIPSPFHGILGDLFNFNLKGILAGDSGLPNFDDLKISGDLVAGESAANKKVLTERGLSTDSGFPDVEVSVDWGGAYSFGVPKPGIPGASYPFKSQNTSLSLSFKVTEKFPVIPDILTFSAFGSAGAQVIATLTPTDPSYQPPFFAGIKQFPGDLLTITLIPPVGSIFGVAEAVGTSIEDVIGGANGELQLKDLFFGVPLSVGVGGTFKIPYLLKLSLTGSMVLTPFLDIIEKPSSAFDIGATFAIPIKAKGTVGGFLSVETSINPKFRWDSNYPTASSSNPTKTTNITKTQELLSEATVDSPTATVNGSLLTLDFGTDLNQDNIPDPSQFTVYVLDNDGNPITDPQTQQPETINVFAVVMNDQGVILRLDQPFAHGGTGNYNDQLQVKYKTSSTPPKNLQDVNGNQISAISDLAVTNNSSDSIAYTFNPVGGTNQDYSTDSLKSVVPSVTQEFAEDSPPALSLISSEQILLAWSSSTPTLTPVEAVVSGKQIFLNFATEIGTQQTELALSQLFTVTKNGSPSSFTVNTIDDNTVVLQLTSAAAPQDKVTISYQPSSSVANNKNLYFTNGAKATLYVPEFDQIEVTNTTGVTTAPVLLSAQAVENQIRLIFNQVLDETSIPDISQFEFSVNNQAAFSLTGAVQVNHNVVTLIVKAGAGQQPIIRPGDVVSIDYSLDANDPSNNLTNDSSVEVAAFNNQIVTTSPSAPSSVINTAFSPFGNTDISNPISIIGSDGINYAPAAAQDQNNKSVVVWAHGNVAELSEKLLPGEIYEDNDVIEINNALEATDIYFSVLGANNNWSVASPIATNQPGTDSQVTLGQGPNGQLMAAWLNTQTESNGDPKTTIYYSLWSGSAWSLPGVILSEVEPDPATELSISTINNQPAVFWTETQPTAYAGLVVQSNPLIYLSLGEITGTTAVNLGKIGAAANGTYSGSYTLNQTGALAGNTSNPGDPNPAVVFSNGGKLTTPEIGYSGNSFSVEFWFKAPTLTSATLVSGGSLFNFSLSSTNLTFSASGTSVTSSKDGQNQPLKSNQWYYVVGTYDGDSKTITLYLNGQQVATRDNVSITPSTDSYSLTLGGSTASVYLDEVAFYDQVLNNNTTTIESVQNNPQDLTGTQLQELLTQSTAISDKYKARFNEPLPPGADTNYSVWNGTTWEKPANIEAKALIVPTQLADAKNPFWDIASPTSIEPNGISDVYFPFTVPNQQNREITGITITDSSGKVIASTDNKNLAVTQNNQILNPEGTFTHQVLGETEELGLFLDNGKGSKITGATITVTFASGSPASASNQASADSSSEVSTINSTTVLATATVTEANDSSLALIDSGFIIPTGNTSVGTVLAKGQVGSNPYVAVYNSGYQASATQGQNGTVQVLFGGTGVLGNNTTKPLSNTDLTTNPGGFLITGIPDLGIANGDFPASLATGDLDGDGYDELIIGAPNVNNHQGAVYVILGSYLHLNSNKTINVANLTPAQGYQINLNAKAGDLAGFALAVGKFSGDSQLVLAVGAPNTNSGAGAVYGIRGTNTSPSYTNVGDNYQIQDPSNPQDPTAKITVGSQFGYALGVSQQTSSNTAFANSGGDNLIVGAPGYLAKVNNNWQGADELPTAPSQPFPSNSQVQVGAVYIYNTYPGSYNTLITGPQVASASGTAEATRFGSAITSDDWDGDKRNDLAISATGTNAGTGTVYALKGGSLGSSRSAQPINQVKHLEIKGGISSGEAGSVIASPGDLNQDTFNDLLITAPDSANGTGQSYVMFGRKNVFNYKEYDLSPTATGNKANLLLNGSNPYDQAGVAATPVGDVNGDTVDDLMISAPGAEEMYVVYGHPWLADDGSLKLADISGDNGFVIDGDEYPGVGSGNGKYVVMLGDINGDGFADVLSGGDNGAIITFGGSTKDLLDASIGSDELIVKPTGGTFKQFVSLGDINGDGLQDFGALISDQTFYLIKGSSDLASKGTIQINKADYLNITGEPGNSITGEVTGGIGDRNGDGYDEYALVQGVVYGNATSTFEEHVVIQGGDNEPSKGVGDINGDGYSDLVQILSPQAETSTSTGYSGTFNFNQLQSYLGSTSKGSTASSEYLGSSDSPFYGTQNGKALESAGDFNGDGIADAMVSTAQADGVIVWTDGSEKINYGYFNPREINWNSDTSYTLKGAGKPDLVDGISSSVPIGLASYDNKWYMSWSTGENTYQEYSGSNPFQKNTFGSNNDYKYPVLVTANGNLYQITHGYDSENPYISEFNTTNGTFGYEPTSLANTDGNRVWAASVGNQISFAWTHDSNLYYGEYNTSNGTIGNYASVTLSSLGVADDNNPLSMTSLNGILYVALLGSDNQVYITTLDVSKAESVPWTYAVPTGLKTEADGLSLMTLEGEIYASWYDSTNSKNVYLKKYDPSTNQFSTANVELPQVDIDNGTSNFPAITPFANSGTTSILLGNSQANGDQIVKIQGLTGYNSSPTATTSKYENLGDKITNIGDVNGDGFDDVLITDPVFNDDEGGAFVVFGTDSTEPIELKDLIANQKNSGSSSKGFSITGLPDSEAAISISGGEDVNGDGFEDFMMGAPGDNDNLGYVLFGSDFTQEVNQTGTIGDDVILGSATGENIVTGQGDDEIYSHGGIDVVYAGPDEDLVTVSDTNFRRLDGGAGTDILGFTGETDQDWDLTKLSPGLRLRNFEVLDLTDYGSNTLTLNSLTVNSLSNTTNTITVVLDPTDKLSLSSDLVTKGTIYQNGTNYYKYQSNTTAAVVLVNASVGSGFTPTFTASNTNTPSPLVPAEANTAQASKATSPSETKQPKALVKETSTNLPQPTRIHISNPVTSEAEKETIFKLERSGNVGGYAVVKYVTQDGRAKAGNDYQTVTGNLVFTPGKGDITVGVPLLSDEIFTGTRKFNLEVTLSSQPKALKGTPAPNTLKGTDGDDYIIGYQSRDLLTGGAGNDVFGYTSIVEAGDIITDFKVGNDLIDLSAVLKNVGFTGLNGISKGYVGFKASGANTIVTLDADGPSGTGTARPFALVQNVSVGQLNNPSNFIFI